MGFLKKIKAKLEDLNGFLKENKSKIGGFPPIRGRMESMNIRPASRLNFSVKELE